MRTFWSWLADLDPWKPDNLKCEFLEANEILLGLSQASSERFAVDLGEWAEKRMMMFEMYKTMKTSERWLLRGYFKCRVMVQFIEVKVITAVVAKVDELVAVFNEAVQERELQVGLNDDRRRNAKRDRVGLKGAVHQIRAIDIQAKAAFRKYAADESRVSVPSDADETTCEAIKERFKYLGHRGILEKLPSWENPWSPRLLRWGLIAAVASNLQTRVYNDIGKVETLNLPNPTDVDFNYQNDDQRKAQFNQFRRVVSDFNDLCGFLKALEDALPEFFALRDTTCLALFEGVPM